MENWIDRYVYDVTRRLPEKDRDEVSKELRSNIYDMLPDQADESDIKTVLYTLGPPVSLAEKYRQCPRYLISPAVYDEYIRALKWVLPLVGSIVLAIGMILGAVQAIKGGVVDVPYFISNIVSKGVFLGMSAAFQALLWVTIGFIIADRTGSKTNSEEEEWKIEDLPEVLPNDRNKIPLSDTIIELAVVVVFSVIGILACSGILPIMFTFQTGNIQVRTLFSSSFLISCIPAIGVMALFSVGECIVKIKARRWTPFVCGAVIVSNLVSMGILLSLINRSDLFSEEFISFVQDMDWGGLDVLRFIGTGDLNPIIVFISAIIVVSCLADCCIAVYKTFLYKR